MSLEVYLLSVPLARHRTIVPRPRRLGISVPGSSLRTTEQRQPGAVLAQAESSVSADSLQRFESA
jgi:hypothetical protein